MTAPIRINALTEQLIMCKNGSEDKKCFTAQLRALSSILKIQRIRLAGLEAQIDQLQGRSPS